MCGIVIIDALSITLVVLPHVGLSYPRWSPFVPCREELGVTNPQSSGQGIEADSFLWGWILLLAFCPPTRLSVRGDVDAVVMSGS